MMNDICKTLTYASQVRLHNEVGNVKSSCTIHLTSHKCQVDLNNYPYTTHLSITMDSHRSHKRSAPYVHISGYSPILHTLTVHTPTAIIDYQIDQNTPMECVQIHALHVNSATSTIYFPVTIKHLDVCVDNPTYIIPSAIYNLITCTNLLYVNMRCSQDYVMLPDVAIHRIDNVSAFIISHGTRTFHCMSYWNVHLNYNSKHMYCTRYTL